MQMPNTGFFPRMVLAFSTAYGAALGSPWIRELRRSRQDKGQTRARKYSGATGGRRKGTALGSPWTGQGGGASGGTGVQRELDSGVAGGGRGVIPLLEGDVTGAICFSACRARQLFTRNAPERDRPPAWPQPQLLKSSRHAAHTTLPPSRPPSRHLPRCIWHPPCSAPTT